MTLGILSIIELTVPQLYTIELELPSKIDELITMAYNTSVNPLLHQLITIKTASARTLLTNL